jgi:hypothetical protein
MNLKKQLKEEYIEEFKRPDGSIALLIEEEAIFQRAVMTLNYFNEDKQNGEKSKFTRTTT